MALTKKLKEPEMVMKIKVAGVTMGNTRVLGQNHIEKHFENAIKLGKISHAYIINGEKGSGKMALAVNFAKALQCENSQNMGKACCECKSCKQTDSKNQPDIKYITYEKSGIGIDDIRTQLNEDIEIKPYSSKYKVYIIPQSETMTVQAQNALLKTIEEPPAYAVIILLTTNAEMFLPTILSRCVMLNMRPVKDEVIKNKLMAEYGIGEYDARVAAAFSGGNTGKAVRLATSEDFIELKKSVIESIQALENGGMDVISAEVKKAKEIKKDIDEYFSLMRIWFRDLLLYKATQKVDSLIFQDDYQAIEEMSKKYSFYDLDIIIKAIEQAESRIKSNVNFDATIEILLLVIKERIKND